MSLQDMIKKESKRLEKKAAERGSQFEKTDWFKVQKGGDAQIIRILPNLKNNEGHPFVRKTIHWLTAEGANGKPYQMPTRCLRDIEGAKHDCPVCVTYEAKMKKAKEKSTEEKKKAMREKYKDLRPTEVFIYNVLNYDEKKVQPFALSSTAHEAVIMYINDAFETDSNILSLEEGSDWKIKKKIDPKKQAKYQNTTVLIPLPKTSRIPPKLLPLLKDVTPLDSYYNECDVEKMLAFIESYGIDVSEFSDVVAPSVKGSSKKKDEDEEEEDEDDEPKSKKSKKSRDEDEDEDDEDEDEDDEPKSKKSKKVVDEDEESEEDDEDDEDEDDEPKSKKSSKKKDDDEDEDESEDEDDDEDESPKFKRKSRKDEEEDEDEEPKSKKSKKAVDEDEDDEDEKPKSKKSSKKKDDDDEDEDMADLEIEDDDLEKELRKMGAV